MPSLLASQLSQGISLNAPLLSETARRKHFSSSSYLFSSLSKSQIDDLDAIHALSINALEHLKHIYPSVLAISDKNSHTFRLVFSSRARETDRTLITPEELTELNAALKQCMQALGPCLMEGHTGRIIEWLVRRFRINEFNVQDILSLFMPYHESPHFAKMVSILSIDDNSPWRFLSAFKTLGKPLPRSVLTTEMLKSKELTRYIVNLLPEALSTSKGVNVHRTLLCFNTAILLEYITRAGKKDLDAGLVATLLPSLTEPIKVGIERSISRELVKDGVLGSFVLLAALSQRCSFTPAATKTIASGMIHCVFMTAVVDAHQLITALLSFLSGQETLQDLPANCISEFVCLPDIIDALQYAVQWVGFEKMMNPILGGIIQNDTDTKNMEVIHFLLSSNQTPELVLRRLAKLLLLKGNDEFLFLMFQRHPEALRDARCELVAEDEEKLQELDKLLLRLAVPLSSGSELHDLILTSTSSEASTRASSLKHIADILENGEKVEKLSKDDRVALLQVLQDRVMDTDAPVIETLYQHPLQLEFLFSGCPNILETIAKSLKEQPISCSVLLAHLSYYCNAYIEAHPEDTERVIRVFLLPFSLYTKARGKIVRAVWEDVSKSRIAEHKLLKGIAQITQSEGEAWKKNVLIAAKLAENMNTTDAHPELLDWLLQSITDNRDVHLRSLSLLVLHSFISNLNGGHKVDVSLRVLDTIVTNGIDRTQLEPDMVFEEDAVLKNVFSKPNSAKTLKRLELMLLSLLSTIPYASSSQPEFQWFDDLNNVNTISSQSSRFLLLQKNVYTLLNASISTTETISQINNNIFTHFGSDTLLFLASLWISPPSLPNIITDTTRYIALRHALAFIRAKTTDDHVIDIQTVLPSLLVSLQSTDRRVRLVTMDCITTLAAAASKPSGVYAYDVVYGRVSADLKYLEWSDELHYLKLMASNRDQLVNDPDHLMPFNYEFLSPSKAENRKDTRQRRRILCYLISHAVCCPSQVVQLSILRSLHHVSDPIKFQMLIPLIERGISRTPSENKNTELEKYVLEVYDSSAAKDLNSEEGDSWLTLTRVLKYYLGFRNVTIQWKTLYSNLQNSLFAHLSNKRQLELCLILIDFGIQVDDEFDIKNLLGGCISQPGLMVALLQSVQPDVSISTERVSKKAKMDLGSSGLQDIFPRITLLAEILSSKALPGSLELISSLLDSLSRIISFTALDRAELLYLEQLLMTCIESAASSIKELPNLSPNIIRIDALVELMRTSENPQTFHQALLLMASLARLSPASVLSNIMPIFTFMGSNILHRDDSYSFKVIQKTTESIVPVAVASLKEKYNDPLDLFIGSRDLLRTFTDASPHIPRHRRTSFFAHLVDVLNPTEYLAPVIMLLADKVSNRVSRQSRQEASTTLSLPLNIMAHHKTATVFSAMREVVAEVKRLISLVTGQDSNLKIFLEASASDDHAISASVIRRRQCQTLLLLIGMGMKQINFASADDESKNNLKLVVTSLLEVLSNVSLTQDVPGMKEVVDAAQWALLESMSIISVAYFVDTSLTILNSDNVPVIKGALELISIRVPDIKAETRKSIRSVMDRIVLRINTIASQTQDFELLSRSMQALLSIASHSQPGEESALVETISTVTDVVTKFPELRPAIALISVLTTKLGPRIIPYLRLLISANITVLESTSTSLHNEGQDIIAEGFRSLSSLVTTVPTFWGQQEVIVVLKFFIRESAIAHSEVPSQLGKLIKLLARQIPSKIVLPSIIQCWPSNNELRKPDGANRYERFSELLKRCIHCASRPDVLENLRPLFTHFLEAFDLRSILPSESAVKLENKIINAFLELVTKLNETAFQPLFRKACDWAFGDNSSPGRKITFCRLYAAHLDLFRDLMTPYMSLLLDRFVELLESFTKSENDDKDLWAATITTLSKSFKVDDGAFWRDEKLRRITRPLTQQILVCITNLRISESDRNQLLDCLTASVDCMEDDTTANTINQAILALTRSEDVRVRLFALQCASSIWRAHGSKLRGFGPETATSIIECADDENDSVVRECRHLKDAVEAVTGKIDGL